MRRYAKVQAGRVLGPCLGVLTGTVFANTCCPNRYGYGGYGGYGYVVPVQPQTTVVRTTTGYLGQYGPGAVVVAGTANANMHDEKEMYGDAGHVADLSNLKWQGGEHS